MLEANYEAKWEFPGRRGGAKQKTFCGGEYGHFLELRNQAYPDTTFCKVEN